MISIPVKKEFLLLLNLLLLLTFFFNPAPAATPMSSSLPESTLVTSLSSPDSVELFKAKLAVANTIIDAKANLGIWGVFIGLNPDSIPPENIFQQEYLNVESRLINLRGIINYEEGLIITLIEFEQKGVPKFTKPSEYNLKNNVLEPVGSFVMRLFGKKKAVHAPEGNEPYADYIQTTLIVFVQAVDIRKERLIGSFSIDITHAGGNKSESFKNALKKLEKKVMLELKILFLISSEVTFLTPNKGTISLNGNYVYPNMLFEVIEPDRIQREGDETLVIPGKRAGIAMVVDTLATRSLIKFVRKWKPGSPGCWAVEYAYPVFAFQVNYHPPTNYSYQRLDFQFNMSPLKKYDVGGGFHFLKIRDDRDNEVGGFGFFGFLLWRMYYSDRFTFGTKFGLDLDIPMRTDDDGNNVNLVVPSISTSLNTEFLISERIDLVMNFGYRIAKSANGWEYTVDEESLPAYWTDYYPRINNTGLLFSLGFRFLLF
jgi:hypothetical protein